MSEEKGQFKNGYFEKKAKIDSRNMDIALVNCQLISTRLINNKPFKN